jgi:hypothetical protein
MHTHEELSAGQECRVGRDTQVTQYEPCPYRAYSSEEISHTTNDSSTGREQASRREVVNALEVVK